LWAERRKVKGENGKGTKEEKKEVQMKRSRKKKQGEVRIASLKGWKKSFKKE